MRRILVADASGTKRLAIAAVAAIAALALNLQPVIYLRLRPISETLGDLANGAVPLGVGIFSLAIAIRASNHPTTASRLLLLLVIGLFLVLVLFALPWFF